MQVEEALKKRKSTRAFLDKPVEDETVTRILEVARYSASGANTQPWEVAVVRGKSRELLQEKLVEAFQQGVKSHPDIPPYPKVWNSPFRDRRIACGAQLYDALNIQRDEKQRRLAQWVSNYRSFGAPVVLFLMIKKELETGSYIDMGMFLQSIMLKACEEGLATCPQAALAEYPDIVREELGYDDSYHVVCGMALGYEDPDAPINSYRTTREPVTNFTRYFE